MEGVRTRRLTNELGSLRHVHGILVEFDTDENLMRVRMQKKNYLIRIPAKYPFEPPSITDQKGSVIRIDEKTMYSITDILTGLRTRENRLSDVFQHEDDPDVLAIKARKREEALKLAVRTQVKAQSKERNSMVKMAHFILSNQESSSDESGAGFKSTKLKKPRKKKESDPSQKKINSFFKQDVDTSTEKESNNELEEARDYTPSIDELLKLPYCPEDGVKTMDEVLDDLDIEIAERKQKHEEEMAKIDTDIAAEKRRQEERRERMKKNTLLRNRLEVEITESVLRKMFEENREYLKNIETGRVESSRHQAFHKSSRTRHALYYTMITDPFTDNQLEWTLEEMGRVWMKTKREQMDNNEYVWKVLLAECFIKFYMDFFGFDKKEAEKRISETPLRKDSEGENSSDDDM